MAPAIPVITLVVSAVATAYSVYAQQQASNFQSAMAKRNADAAEAAARDASGRGLNEQIKVGLVGGAARGIARAKFGSAGVSLSSGSPLDVVSDISMMNELDRQTAKANTDREAAGFTNQAGNFLLQGAMDSSASRNNAFGSLLTGASSAAGNYYNQKRP